LPIAFDSFHLGGPLWRAVTAGGRTEARFTEPFTVQSRASGQINGADAAGNTSFPPELPNRERFSLFLYAVTIPASAEGLAHVVYSKFCSALSTEYFLWHYNHSSSFRLCDGCAGYVDYFDGADCKRELHEQ
jgi:hypothetical protein